MSEDVQGLEPHQIRVVQEKLDLDEKLDKLLQFIGTQLFESLPGEERWLLREQAQSMGAYSNILGSRIRRWREGR